MKLYKIKEVAEMLSVTYNTIWNLIQSGQVRSVNVGRTLRVSEEEVQRLVEVGTKEGD